MEIGSHVKIAPNAKYGGRTIARGAFVPTYLCNQEFSVAAIDEIEGKQEAFLLEPQSWIPDKHLIELAHIPKQKKSRRNQRKYGVAATRLYRIWGGMKSRCYNPNQRNYKYYGAKGIEVCEEWKSSFEAFRKWATENGYQEDLTIDRIDGDKGYSPDNCRWTTMSEQLKNRRQFKK